MLVVSNSAYRFTNGSQVIILSNVGSDSEKSSSQACGSNDKLKFKRLIEYSFEYLKIKIAFSLLCVSLTLTNTHCCFGSGKF